MTAFRGIPFARPPVGELRFQPPQPPAAWSGVRDAKDFAPIAYQQEVLLPVLGKLWRWLRGNQSEDCLYLNVWTPGGPPARRPVMVWIHGGGFLFGSGTFLLYRGRELARRGDVVVVTLNYRLGVLGFLDPRELGAPRDAGFVPNLGLRDQLAALRWVQENIAGFGGDPDNITVFGQSAGAMSVGALLAAPAAQGLFHRAILQSGAAHHISTGDDSARYGRRFLRHLGLETFDPRVLQDLSPKQLLKAQTQAIPGIPARGLLPWQPTVGDDLLPRPPLDAIADGAASGVELIVGTNHDEWAFFTPARPSLRTLTWQQLERHAERILREHRIEGITGAEALAVYRASRKEELDSPYRLYVALRTDEVFRIPAQQLLETQAPHQPRIFCYRLDFPVPALSSTLGACHGADLPLVFGTHTHPALLPFFLASGEARRLSDAIQDAWSSFARRGSPSHSSVGPWAPWEPVARKTMILDQDCRLERAPREAERRLWLGQP